MLDKILIVDDEEVVLTFLKEVLEEKGYQVLTAISARKALKVLHDEKECRMVICDIKMPDMDGLSFLDAVKKIKPEVPRIILTGYADKENAIKAINDVGLFQYIEKPWNNDDLLIILRNGIAKNSLMRKLQGKIKEINDAYGELEDLHNEIVKTFV